MKLVYLNDNKMTYDIANDHFDQANKWAKENCISYIGYRVEDVSDVSYVYDLIAEYKFRDPKEAVWFELRYR